MDRSKTLIAGLALTGVAAATSATVLGVPSIATMDQARTEAAIALPVATDLWGTIYQLPANYVSFYLNQGVLQHYGDISGFPEETLEAIAAQLQAAPERSALIVDTDSLGTEGLTTILTTVTPTNGMMIATTHEEMQQWLVGLFPGVEGSVSSQPIENRANAAFTHTVVDEERTWTVTEAIYQYADASVTVRVSTLDDTGEVAEEVAGILAGMTRG